MCDYYGSCQNITIIANYSDSLNARLKTPKDIQSPLHVQSNSNSATYTKVYAARRNDMICWSSNITNSKENDCDNVDIYSKRGSM